MNRATELRRLLESTPYPSPRLRYEGHFDLWTSYVEGYLSRLEDGVPLGEEAEAIMEAGADDETLRLAASLSSKPNPTEEERTFLEYWEVLEDARKTILEAARSEKVRTERTKR